MKSGNGSGVTETETETDRVSSGMVAQKNRKIGNSGLKK